MGPLFDQFLNSKSHALVYAMSAFIYAVKNLILFRAFSCVCVCVHFNKP